MKKKAQGEIASVEAKAIASTQDPRMKLLLGEKKKVDLPADKYCLHLGTLTSYSLPSQLKVHHSVIRHGPVGVYFALFKD